MICPLCSKEHKNPKFCSRSCAVTFNNKLTAKRKLGGCCKECKIAIKTKMTYCKNCSQKIHVNLLTTIGDITYIKRNKYKTYSYIRYLARQKALSLGWTICAHCGYDKHIEIAHKKAISDFEETSLLSEVNHESNLIALCPNCHWELDNL